MKRSWTILIVVALAFTTALAAGAAPNCDKVPDHPKCPGGPQRLVEVSIEANLTSAHEAGDTIYYTFGVTNGSNQVVTVTDELDTLSETVPSGESAAFEGSYVLNDDDMPATIGDTRDLTNTVEATLSGEIITREMAIVKVVSYGLCDTDGNGVFQTDGLPCIWKPQPGNWTISVVPTRPTRAMITVRDHTPGNWCPQGVTEKWRPGDDPVQTTVTIPEWPSDWAGGPVCPIGGAAGDFYDVGTPSSFYLATNGNVTVTPVP